jgi:molybdate transport system ATP-binding protein
VSRVRAETGYVEARLRDVSLSRNDRPVFRELSWCIRPGQRWLLMGPNGAGKTQLLKLLAGDVWPTPTGRESQVYRWRGRTYTEPYIVKDEIAYVGAERQDKYEHYDWDFKVANLVGTGIHRTDIPRDPLSAADRRRLASLLARFGLAHLGGRRFLTLSYGQRRLVLLARALATRPKLLLLDEPFEGLDRDKHALISRWLESTARSGLPWVLATHRMKDMPAAATHVALLEGGRMTYQGPRSRAPQPVDLRRAARGVAGRAGNARPRNDPSAKGRTLLVRLSKASVYFGPDRILRDVSFEVRAGDCWVLHGPNGSGKTTLLRTLYGDYGVGAEAIKRFGVEPGVPLERFKRRVGWVSPNLQTDHSLRLTAREVVQSGRYASVGLNDRATAADRAAARRALAFFGLQALAAREVRELSYGQMRRVLFARAWASRPKLLLLDEPLAGVDAKTRVVLRKDLDRAIREGVAVVMTTHHDDEWPAHATHELELREGRVVYCGPLRRTGSRVHR